MSFKFIGCPGGGKTTALLSHIIEPALAGEFFGEQILPEQMLYSTFTRAGANEARDRAIKRFGFDEERFPYFRTLHSICFRLLELKRADVISGKQFKEFCKEAGFGTAAEEKQKDPDQEDQLPDTDNEENLDGDCYLEILSLARSRLTSIEVEFDLYDAGGRAEIDMDGMKRFQTLYNVWRKGKELRDFTDMIEETIQKGIVPEGVKAIIVDEAQDLSPLQHKLVEMWIEKLSPKLIAFGGDEDQEIYNWAGSRGMWLVEKPVNFQIPLAVSWRVPSAVASISLNLINRNVNRTEGKTWKAKNQGGEVMDGSSGDFAKWVGQAGTSFVLARNRYIVRRLKARLVGEGIPHAYIAKRHVGSSIPIATSTLIELAAGGEISIRQLKGALEKVPQDPWLIRGFKAGLEKLEDQDRTIRLDDLAKMGPGPEFMERMKSIPTCLDPLERITPEMRRYSITVYEQLGSKAWTEPAPCGLSTIHGVKGLEADRVVLDLGMSKRTYKSYLEDGESERRVWYVGATRTKGELMFIRSGMQERHFHELIG